MSEASPFSTIVDTPSMMTASTNYTATPGLPTAATDFTMSPATTNVGSKNTTKAAEPGARPSTDIKGFTSTFGHTPALANLSSGLGFSVSAGNSHPQSQHSSNQRVRPLILKLKTSHHTTEKTDSRQTMSQPAVPATPGEADTSMSMDYSPAHTADTNPGMISDNEEMHSQDEDISEVNMEHPRKLSTAVRIRSSLDTTSYAESLDEKKNR